MQLDSINTSVSVVIKSFQDAPELQSLPGSVLQLQTELAGIGSRVAGLESGLESMQTEASKSFENLNRTFEVLRGQTVRSHFP